MSIILFKNVMYFKVLIIIYTILNNENTVKQVPKIGFNLGTVPNISFRCYNDYED